MAKNGIRSALSIGMYATLLILTNELSIKIRMDKEMKTIDSPYENELL